MHCFSTIYVPLFSIVANGQLASCSGHLFIFTAACSLDYFEYDDLFLKGGFLFL